MIVNVNGVGKVKFPDNMSLDEINKVLTEAYSKSPDEMSIEKITAIVKGIVKDTVKPEPPVVPDVKVDVAPVASVPEIKVEPVVEVNTVAPDMQPIAEALMAVLSKESNITVQSPERRTVTDIDVLERDTFGNIKRIRMTEVA